MRVFIDSKKHDATVATARKYVAGLRIATLAMLCAAGVGCATTATAPNPRDAQRLAEVSAIAGKPVSSFHYLSLTSYEPIGESDVLVFTSPRQAWLLHLDGPCRDLDFGPFVGLTSTFGRVSTGFDSVLVRGNPIPCRIEQIRPVDTAELRRAEHEHKVEAQPAPGQPPAGK